MSVAPPTYPINATVNSGDAKAVVDAHVKLISKIDKATAGRALNTTLDTPPNKKIIEEHIKTLAADTLQTRKAFEDISLLLQQFDFQKFKTKTGVTIGPLQPGWDALRERYKVLLERSHKDAIVIKAVCDEYVEKIVAMVDDPNINQDEMKKEVAKFLQRTKESESKATPNTKDFDALRFDVDAYHQSITTNFDSAEADPEHKIPELENTIRGLKAKIQEATDYIDRCMTAMIASMAVAGAAGILCIFCPIAAILVVGGLLSEVGASMAASIKLEELHKHKSALRIAEAELARLQAREQTLKDLKAKMVASNGQFSAIVNQLAALTNFWTAINADLMTAQKHLTTAMSPNESLYSFKIDLGQRLGGSCYMALSAALAIYVGQMTLLDTKPQ